MWHRHSCLCTRATSTNSNAQKDVSAHDSFFGLSSAAIQKSSAGGAAELCQAHVPFCFSTNLLIPGNTKYAATPSATGTGPHFSANLSLNTSATIVIRIGAITT